MTRILFGDANCGVQGIYYFNDREYAHTFAKGIKHYLDALRLGDTQNANAFRSKYADNELLNNFLLKMAERVSVELKTPEVWWEPGGSLYGEKWRNELLPNGIGEMYHGDKLVNED